MSSYTISISGMSCGHCVAAVKEALGSISSIESVDVEIGLAHVTTSGAIEADILESVLEDEGYAVTLIEAQDS